MSETQLYLVGVDGSDCGRRAVEFAAKLAASNGNKLLLANIIHWSGFTPLSLDEALNRPLDKKKEERAAVEQVLTPFADLAKEIGATDVEIFHTWGNPARELKKLAKERDAMVIIVGRRGNSSFTDMILGSVANSIAYISDRPVVLVP